MPSRYLPPTPVPLTSDAESSLLPTLTAKANLLSPSMQKWAAHRRLLPTAQSYGSNKGGAAGRVGEERLSLPAMAKRGMLPTLIKSDAHATACPGEMVRHSPRLLATLTRRDASGPGQHHTKGGRDLPQELGGHLSADWCRWFMGFPEGWLDVDDASVFARSATASSRSARKRSAA